MFKSSVFKKELLAFFEIFSGKYNKEIKLILKKL